MKFSKRFKGWEKMNHRKSDKIKIPSIDLGFEIPEERIAQIPLKERDSSKLLVYYRENGRIEHHHFYELPEIIPHESVLILNKTKVVPCRLIMNKESGGKVDVLILRWLENYGSAGRAKVLVKGGGRKNRRGTVLLHNEIKGEIEGRDDEGKVIVRFETKEGKSLKEILNSCALSPLPPYIKRVPDGHDKERYQTVFGCEPGSIAAPTAGLHFTEKLMENLSLFGVEFAFITLHIGEGTFKPIRVESLDEHVMDSEEFEIDEENAEKIKRGLVCGKKIIAVGTSSVRAIEGLMTEEGEIKPFTGKTSLFIKPGFSFKIVKSMITNFHMPASTPLALVSALIGIEEVRRIYRIALENNYRFYSYGDSMLIY